MAELFVRVTYSAVALVVVTLEEEEETLEVVVVTLEVVAFEVRGI